jgi:hypothetical protein
MMRLLITIIFLWCNTVLAANLLKQDQCSQFNNIALQFALTPILPNIQSPFTLEQLQQALGQNKQYSSNTISTYTWTYKNRTLCVRVANSNLTKRFLTGNDDGSLTSRLMEQAYEKLESATSIWTIKEIQKQLGSGIISHRKTYNYIWHCGMGSIEVTADQNNIDAVTIGYKTNQNPEIIDAQFSKNHPAWDVISDSSFGAYRAWKRSF